MLPVWNYPATYYNRSLGVLETALNELPAYRSWRSFDPGARCAVDTRYAVMPSLTKKDIREHFPDGFTPARLKVKDGLESGEISFVKTSGTIDVSVTNIWNQQWWNASEQASWKLNAYASQIASASHPEAILANPLNVGDTSDDVDLPLERRRLARFLFLNEKSDPALWTPALTDRMLRELDEFQPAILEANPSLLARLCRYAAKSGKQVYQPGLIVFTYEYPAGFHHRQIRRIFNTPMASSYGTTETGYVFMQCEAGKFHQNSEFCRVDFQPLQSEHGGPLLGRILVTTFRNPWYYIVRFDVGDLVRLDETGKCTCGRDSGIILTAIEGRTACATLTCSGRLVTLRELDTILSSFEDIEEYRLEQVAPDSYEVHLVSRRGNRQKLSRQISRKLAALYGRNARIAITYEDALSPESSGKYSLAKPFQPVDIEQYLDRTGNPVR